MNKFLVMFALCTGLASAGHKAGPPEVVVIEMHVHRDQGTISVAGRIQNASSKSLNELNVVFQFEDGAGKVVTEQRTTVDEAKLSPAGVSSVNGQMKDAPVAVQVRVLAQTKSGHDLRVGNDGPFPVD
jgi:hypothetical protein